MHRHKFSCSLVHWFKFFPCPLQEWSLVSYELTAQALIPLIRFMLFSLVLSSFLVFLKYSFYYQLYYYSLWVLTLFLTGGFSLKSVWQSSCFSRTLVTFIAYFNSAVVWMILILTLISNPHPILFSWPTIYLWLDVECIPFPSVLVLCEMQTVSSRIYIGLPCPFPMIITDIPWVPPHMRWK